MTTKLMTAADLFEITAPGRFELIRGVLIETGLSGFEHSTIVSNVILHVGNYVHEHDSGSLTGVHAGYHMEFDPDTVLSPDVAFVRADRLPPREERQGFLALAPDLAVEVISHTDLAEHVMAMVNLYLTLGVRLLWILYPSEQSVMVFTPARTVRMLSATDTLDGGDVLPGFAVTVSELFK